MKKFILIAISVMLLASCTQTKHNSSRFPYYATVEIGTKDSKYLDAISENGREVLNLYRFAAKEVDNIYWQQAAGGKGILDNISDPEIKNIVEINYGPWNRLDGKPFTPGLSDLPKGLCFYPKDMTDEEWNALDNPDKNSAYTLIRRDENDSLQVVWYHDEYKASISKICNFLTAAADITIVPSVRTYLLAKAQDLQTDNYRNSTIKWLKTTDSKMDLVIGPNENSDDNLYGIKRSYSCLIILKNLNRIGTFAEISSKLPQIQAGLPCPEEYKSTYTPGTESQIYSGDVLYYSGEANCAIKDVAVNLPYDNNYQAEFGTRSIIMENVINAKYNAIVVPLADLMLSDADRENVDGQAFFWNVAYRELAHGLGVKNTVDGRDVNDALGNANLSIEDAKALVLGAHLSANAIATHQVDDIVTENSAYATFLASLLRSARFGTAEAVGRGNLICYNYLKEHGAYSRHHDGCYYINYAAFAEAADSLISDLITLQAKGDYQAATDFIDKYAVIDKDLESDIFNMGLEQIPVDIKFNFAW